MSIFSRESQYHSIAIIAWLFSSFDAGVAAAAAVAHVVVVGKATVSSDVVAASTDRHCYYD